MKSWQNIFIFDKHCKLRDPTILISCKKNCRNYTRVHIITLELIEQLQKQKQKKPEILKCTTYKGTNIRIARDISRTQSTKVKSKETSLKYWEENHQCRILKQQNYVLKL